MAGTPQRRVGSENHAIGRRGMRFPALTRTLTPGHVALLLAAVLALAALAAPALLGVQAQDDRAPATAASTAEDADTAPVAVALKQETKTTQKQGSNNNTAQKQVAKAPEAKKAPSKATKAAKPKPTPAKELFGAAKTPAPLAARSIGFYAKGCLAGAAALPVDGPAWQAMRLSRNRNWGHPDLIALLEKFAVDAKQHDGWPGLLVGDIAQPRGGPMLTGHASHQIGLDADVWFTPMPDRRLSEKEREDLSATSMRADDRVSVNPKVWTEAHGRLLKRIAGYQTVERVLVHPAIKKAVCEATAKDKG